MKMSMNMKLMGSLISFIWLAIAATSAQQSGGTPVVDTSGQPLRRGVEYIIKLAITDNGGPFTLIDRNGKCPFYVGQRNVTADGIPVIFSPLDENETIVRLNRNFKVAFSGVSRCVQSTTWKVGQGKRDTVNGRRLITTGDDERYNYFNIVLDGDFVDIYRMVWCPAEVCPTCRFRCLSVGSLFENGKKLAALEDSPSAALPIVFERV